MPEIIVIAHNIRSIHNVGSIFRTCEGFGVKRLILSGYTPYPATKNDGRLPHIREKLTERIHKTALGAEELIEFEYQATPDFKKLQNDGFVVVALEQAKNSSSIRNFKPAQKIALLLGEEVNGIEDDLLEQCDEIIEIPMRGQKESFNVSVATGIALFQLSLL
jgi:tRNA G18 (ribose-2'-O)-methylase SpoU